MKYDVYSTVMAAKAANDGPTVNTTAAPTRVLTNVTIEEAVAKAQALVADLERGQQVGGYVVEVREATTGAVVRKWVHRVVQEE